MQAFVFIKRVPPGAQGQSDPRASSTRVYSCVAYHTAENVIHLYFLLFKDSKSVAEFATAEKLAPYFTAIHLEGPSKGENLVGAACQD